MAPRQRENPVEHVDGFFEGLCVGKFDAVLLANWNKEPVIGIIKEILEDEFEIHYWKGTYFGKWVPQNKIRSTEPWIDKLPKECIILHSFDLTSDMKLQPTTRKHLKNNYALLKTNANSENL